MLIYVSIMLTRRAVYSTVYPTSFIYETVTSTDDVRGSLSILRPF
jgi:hypothetical protein